MHSNFEVFDCHADTITIKNLFHTKSHLDVRDMKKYLRYIQVFAICSENGYAYSHAVHHIKRFEKMIKLWSLEKITDKDSLLKQTVAVVCVSVVVGVIIAILDFMIQYGVDFMMSL